MSESHAEKRQRELAVWKREARLMYGGGADHLWLNRFESLYRDYRDLLTEQDALREAARVLENCPFELLPRSRQSGEWLRERAAALNAVWALPKQQEALKRTYGGPVPPEDLPKAAEYVRQRGWAKQQEDET